MKKHLFFYLMGVMLLAAACSEDEVTPNETPLEELQENSVELSTTEVDFDGGTLTKAVYVMNGEEGGWYIASVTVDGEETLLSEAEQEAMRNGEGFERTFDWLTVSVEGGVISLTTDEAGLEERTFSIALVAGGETILISGRQAAAALDDGPIVAVPDSVHFDFEGGTATVETGKDTWWVARIVVDGKEYPIYEDDAPIQLENRAFEKTFDWLTVKVEGTQLVLTATRNGVHDNGIDDVFRECSIVLTTGIRECEIKVEQDPILTGYHGGDGVFTMTPNELEIGPEGGTVLVKGEKRSWWFADLKLDGVRQVLGIFEDPMVAGELAKNRKYKRTFDWLTVNVVGADLELTVEPNTEGKERTFYILVTDYFETGTVTGVQRAE